jgi:hypothetical protein
MIEHALLDLELQIFAQASRRACSSLPLSLP